jgi:hypothetical protein
MMLGHAGSSTSRSSLMLCGRISARALLRICRPALPFALLYFLIPIGSWTRTSTRITAAPRPRSADVLSPDAQARLLDTYRAAPRYFELNRGQTDARVRFLSRHGSSALFLTAGGAVLAFNPKLSETAKPPAKRAVLSLTWTHASAHHSIAGIGKLPSRTNYFVGSDERNWVTGIPSYSKVEYRGLYPGVNLLFYYSKGDQLEYDLELSPGASAGNISLNVAGCDRLRIAASGDLNIDTAGEKVVLHRPLAYQPDRGNRRFLEARFVLKGPSQIGFVIGAYDRSRPLVIDPQLTYSSYLGGSANDVAERVAVDAAGYAYVVGWSESADFPASRALQSTNHGSTSVFISKLNPELRGAASLIYSTFLGGTGTNSGRSIAVSPAGEVVVAGDTNAPDFPVTSGAFQPSCKMHRRSCSTDAFISKINAAGNELLYSTYLGGSGTEFGFSVALGESGQIFLVGNTDSPDFPVTRRAFQTEFGGGPSTFGDAFAVELDPAGKGRRDLLYSTYLGGSGSESAWAVASDRVGNIYVGGSTSSPNFPVTPGAYQPHFGGGSASTGDGFVAKLRPAGMGSKDLVYGTFLGGSADDRVEGLAVDPSGMIYVTGYTQSANFPITADRAFQPVFGGGTCFGAPCADAFIAQLNPSESAHNSLAYSSFFGGDSIDLGHAIALDSTGKVYITGETTSTNLPLRDPLQDDCTLGCRPLPLTDVLIARFDLTKAGSAGLLFSTYFGGSNVDTGWSIAVDDKGAAYVAGQVFSTDFPIRNAYQHSCSHCTSFTASKHSGDAFLLKICMTNCPPLSLWERMSLAATRLHRHTRNFLHRVYAAVKRRFKSLLGKLHWRRRKIAPRTVRARVIWEFLGEPKVLCSRSVRNRLRARGAA